LRATIVWPSSTGSDVPRKHPIKTPYQIGKYIFSPATHPDTQGRYRASLSIRSGHGSQACDRVFRFLPTFKNRDEAHRFVDEQAQAWLADHAGSGTTAATRMEYAHV